MADPSPSTHPPTLLSTSPGSGVHPAESAELLQATLTGAGAAAWVWNPESREFRWSAELPALYGLPPDATMTPDLPWRQVHPDDATPLRQALKDQLAAGDVLDLEYRIVVRGEVRWLNTRGRRHDAERVLGITLDITERRRAEQLDAESRRALELAATGAPLEACLDAITDALGRLHPGARAAVLRPGRRGESATWTLSSRFPLSIVATLRDAPGGAAPQFDAANGEALSYEDIGASADWPETWRGLCAAHGVRGCLAQPVKGNGGRIAATLCLFLDEARAPSAWERRLAAFGAHVAGIALARHQAEAGLRHERERLRAIFEQSVAGIALYDLQGRVVEANERFGEILGRPRAALLGVHMLEVTHPDDRAESDALFAELVDGRRPSFSIEKRYVRADGTIAWVRKDANLVRDAHGRPLHVAAIAADISERHRADERLRLVIDAVPALIAYIDADTRYQLNNKAYEDWFGHKREAVFGRTMREVLGDASFERLQPHIAAALAGQRASFEGMAPYRYGGTRYIHADYVPDVEPDGTVAGFYAFVTDITAQKQAESLVRDSEQRLREFADTAPSMLWVTDTDNKLVFMSRRWVEHTGQSVEDAYRGGFGWTQMAHPDDRSDVGRRFLEAAARREAFELVYRLHCADGSYRWAFDAGRPRFDKDGRWLGYVGTVLDAHEQTEAREALREADRRKDEFLATLAHELRNPLAPIRNALHLLALAGDKARPQTLLEMLDRQVNHLVRLVDDLMEASRISRGKLALRLEPLDLRDVLRTAVETSRPLLDRGRHTLELLLPDVTLPMVGDAVRLAQIFANLLNNAAKFTDDGGRILLTVERHEGMAVVRVRDNGIGIERDQLPRLFEMFGQLDRQAGRAHGGLGIGLALAQRLAEMHGGSIRAASEGPGRGSTFTVRLPLSVEATRDGNQPVPLGRLNDRRILVVDDNADAADSLAMLLRILGAEVRVAHNGNDAHEIAMAWRPAVVLLDLGMPGMDGFQVARRLRGERSLEGLRLIALTGWGQEEDRQRTRAEGFDHHLIKPVDINLLHALLTTVQADQRHML